MAAVPETSVSIRSRRLSAGESATVIVQRSHNRFNPLPPTVGGRIRPCRCCLSRSRAFQSAPADCRRENRCRPASRRAVQVSIRSRRLSAGEFAAASRCRAVDVSIRSRRLSAGECDRRLTRSASKITFQSAPADCRRENAQRPSRRRDRRSFQSAPADCRRENRCAALPGRGVLRFNPLPPTVGGRMLNVQFGFRPDDRFNPLPPTVGGRITSGSDDPADALVSIRSRRLSAGESAVWRWAAAACKFQSAPADCRRENHARAASGRRLTQQFQSAPADCRRENGRERATSSRCVSFNPLPPTVGGRIEPACRDEVQRFNPLPPTVGGRMTLIHSEPLR